MVQVFVKGLITPYKTQELVEIVVYLKDTLHYLYITIGITEIKL